MLLLSSLVLCASFASCSIVQGHNVALGINKNTNCYEMPVSRLNTTYPGCHKHAMDFDLYVRLAAADPVHEVPTSWGTKLRTGGLAVILLRAGLKIDKLAFARAGKVVLRLALFPMLFEALVNTGSYYWLVLPSLPILSSVKHCLVVSKRIVVKPVV